MDVILEENGVKCEKSLDFEGVSGIIANASIGQWSEVDRVNE